jgi:hypothetical protein
MKRILFLLVLMIVVANFGLTKEFAPIVFAQSAPIINTLSAFEGKKGTVVEIRGGTFIRAGRDAGSVVLFDSVEILTHFQSNSSLIFTVPPSADCGEVSVIVRGPVPGTTLFKNSNPVVFDVDCSTIGRGGAYAEPRIDSISPSSGIGSHSTITVTGVNLVPNPPDEDDLPIAWTEFRTRDLAGELGTHGQAYIEFVSFGRVNIQLRSDFEEGLVRCGIYELQYFNLIGNGLNPITSNKYEFEVTEDCNPPLENPHLVISGFNIAPLEVGVGEEFHIKFELINSGTTATTPYDILIIAGGEILRSVEDLITITNSKVTFDIAHSFESPGQYSITVDAGPHSKTATIIVTGGGTPPPPNEDPPPNEPPPVIGGNLSDYDLDNDCSLSDGEFFNMIDAWISESIENLLFFSGVDAWIGQTSICASTAGSSISIRATHQGILISSADKSEIGPISIYNMDGREIYFKKVASSQLRWNALSSKSEILAIGAYFVKFGKTGEIKKFVVLR